MRFTSPESLTTSKVSSVSGEVAVATTPPCPWLLSPMNWLLNTLNWNVVLETLHNCGGKKKHKGKLKNIEILEKFTKLALNVSQPDAVDLVATTAAPPPFSAVRYLFCATDFN